MDFKIRDKVTEERPMDRNLEILDNIYNKPESFLSRVSQELKRAQRYLCFISYLNIDAQRLGTSEEDKVQTPNMELLDKLRLHIRKSIRQTDVLSGFNNGRISVLLVETNKDGAVLVKNRLNDSIKYFLREVVESPLNWKVVIHAGSFPDDEHTPNSFYDKISSTLTK